MYSNLADHLNSKYRLIGTASDKYECVSIKMITMIRIIWKIIKSTINVYENKLK